MAAVLHIGDAPASDDVIRRRAVKAVVWAGPGAARLLLLRTTSGYKFPGGGVEDDEDVTTALARELDEECGALLRHAGEEIVTVVERHPAAERPGAVFEMTSHYLECAIAPDRRAQRLERYEQDLGLSPEWVGLSEAIAATERAVAAGAAQRWTARELSVLCHLRDSGVGRC